MAITCATGLMQFGRAVGASISQHMMRLPPVRRGEDADDGGVSWPILWAGEDGEAPPAARPGCLFSRLITQLCPMAKRPLLPLVDYQRIYQVIYSVLETSGIARTHRACMFFASAGALILREHYQLEATLSVGSMALMVDEATAQVAIYGREENGAWVYDSHGFHAWVECNGWLIDFMAPIMGKAFKEDGGTFAIPAKMLQKPLSERLEHYLAIQHEGEFFAQSDAKLAESVLESQGIEFNDLIRMCLTWFRKPPKALPPLAMASNIGAPKQLVLRAPTIVGVW